MGRSGPEALLHNIEYTVLVAAGATGSPAHGRVFQVEGDNGMSDLGPNPGGYGVTPAAALWQASPFGFKKSQRRTGGSGGGSPPGSENQY